MKIHHHERGFPTPDEAERILRDAFLAEQSELERTGELRALREHPPTHRRTGALLILLSVAALLALLTCTGCASWTPRERELAYAAGGTIVGALVAGEVEAHRHRDVDGRGCDRNLGPGPAPARQL